MSASIVFRHYGRYSLIPLLFGKALQSKEDPRYLLEQLVSIASYVFPFYGRLTKIFLINQNRTTHVNAPLQDV